MSELDSQAIFVFIYNKQYKSIYETKPTTAKYSLQM
jgi:hypothetical protein